MSDSDKTSTGAPSPEPRPDQRDEKGRMLPGHSANPSGLMKGSFSLLASLRRKLAANPDPETGEGKLCNEISDLILQALRESLVNRDPDVLIDLQPAMALLNRIDPPKHRYEKQVIKRLIISGCVLEKFTDERLAEYVDGVLKLPAKNGKTIDVHASEPEHKNGNGKA